jgi:hypothetical protein
MLIRTIEAGVDNIQAIRASGAVVQVEPRVFLQLLAKCQSTLIITACKNSYFSKKFQYETTYQGFVFYTESAQPIELPEHAEIVIADELWTP